MFQENVQKKNKTEGIDLMQKIFLNNKKKRREVDNIRLYLQLIDPFAFDTTFYVSITASPPPFASTHLHS